MRLDQLHRMLSLETAAGEWWNRLSKTEQQAYLKSHPRSKLGADGEPERSLPQTADAKTHAHLIQRGWQGVEKFASGRATYKHPDHPDHIIRTMDGQWSHVTSKRDGIDDNTLMRGGAHESLRDHLAEFHNERPVGGRMGYGSPPTTRSTAGSSGYYRDGERFRRR